MLWKKNIVCTYVRAYALCNILIIENGKLAIYVTIQVLFIYLYFFLIPIKNVNRKSKCHLTLPSRFLCGQCSPII